MEITESPQNPLFLHPPGGGVSSNPILWLWTCRFCLSLGFSKPVVWGTRCVHPRFLWFSSFPRFPCFPLIQHSSLRQEKGTQTQTFWSGCLRGGGVVLPREGAGAKKFGVSFQNPGKPNFLTGYPGIFGGISRGCPKSLRKKNVRVQFSDPKVVVFVIPVVFVKATRLQTRQFATCHDNFTTDYGFGFRCVSKGVRSSFSLLAWLPIKGKPIIVPKPCILACPL